MVSEDQLTFLRSIDTPTVCNLIEIVAPERRGAGYTASHLHCPFPDLPPMVGFAKTATIRARDPVSGPSYMQKRLDYLDYVAAAPRPSIVVIEDKDDPPGYGAFWGEVQTNVHKALGCLGTVTNGSIRDLAAVAEGFQMLAGSIAPSHAYVHVVEAGGIIEVAGLWVAPGDLIHGDRHGILRIPEEIAAGLPAIAANIQAHKQQVLDLCDSPHFSREKLRALIATDQP